MHDVFGQVHLARQQRHQPADGDRVHVGVVVLGFQPRQAHQRVRVAGYRVVNFADQRLHGIRLHRAPHAGGGEHGTHRLFTGAGNRGGTGDFFAHRYTRCWRGVRGGDQFGRGRLGGSAIVNVQPFGGVNDHFAQAGFAHFLQVARTGNHKAGAPERVIHPRAAQLVHVHAGAQFFNGDFFQCHSSIAFRGTSASGASPDPVEGCSAAFYDK